MPSWICDQLALDACERECTHAGTRRDVVDGKLEAELKPATYTAMTLPSGEHMVRVVAIPESLPPDPGTTIALVMAPNTKHFLSLKNPWVSWTGELVEIKFQSEQEAMPVLSQMKPAR